MKFIKKAEWEHKTECKKCGSQFVVEVDDVHYNSGWFWSVGRYGWSCSRCRKYHKLASSLIPEWVKDLSRNKMVYLGAH